MDIIREENRVVIYAADGRVLAEVDFPANEDGTVTIDHTMVDDSLRGQGVAGKLMQAAADALAATNRKAHLTCTYAISWFGKHPECASVLAEEAKA